MLRGGGGVSSFSAEGLELKVVRSARRLSAMAVPDSSDLKMVIHSVVSMTVFSVTVSPVRL